MKVTESVFSVSYSYDDLYSGLAHLITNTLCHVAQVITQTASFILYHLYTYILFSVFKLPRTCKPGEVDATKKEKPKPPPVFDPKMLRRRQYAVDELITSEYNFQSYITTLVEVYEPAYKDYLDEDDMKLFFGPIHPLIETSKNVAKVFESQCRRGPKDAEIGNLFLHKLDLVAGFVPFISNYLQINTHFSQMNTTDKRFMKLNEELEKKNEPFSSLIVMPVQRMPKYVLLVKEISKATPEWHPDYQPLIDAQEKLKVDAQIADKSIKEANRRGQLMDLERSIRRCPPLLDDKRRLVSRFEPTEERTDLYLLSDMIIISKEKTETLSRKTYNELKKVVDFNKVVSTEKVPEGVNLKTTGADYLIEIQMRSKELQASIDKQLKEMKDEKENGEESVKK